MQCNLDSGVNRIEGCVGGSATFNHGYLVPCLAGGEHLLLD